MVYKRFRFVKPFTCEFGTIPVDSEITILKEAIYFNGGMLNPHYYGLFKELINSEVKNPCYLKEVPIPYNKI